MFSAIDGKCEMPMAHVKSSPFLERTLGENHDGQQDRDPGALSGGQEPEHSWRSSGLYRSRETWEVGTGEGRVPRPDVVPKRVGTPPPQGRGSEEGPEPQADFAPGLFPFLVGLLVT